MATIHARIMADGSHAIVEIDSYGAPMLDGDGDTAWFGWDAFELTGVTDN